jgi:hypothetical protein
VTGTGAEGGPSRQAGTGLSGDEQTVAPVRPAPEEREPQEQQDLQFVGADTLAGKTPEPASGGKHVRWADEEDSKAVDDLLRDSETRVGDFNDSVVAIWLPGAPEGGPDPDDPRTIEALADILPPQTVFVMADIRAGQVMHGDRPVSLERLAAAVAVLAPGRQPFLLTPGVSSIAGPLADVTEGPVLAAPHGAHLDLEAGTLTALGRGTPAVPPTGSVAEGSADRFRLFMPHEPAEPDGVALFSVLTRTLASAATETPATTSKGKGKEKEEEKEPAGVQQDPPPPGQDGTGPTTIDPMIRSIVFPRTDLDLPYMPQLISALERELEAQGVIAENEKLQPLSEWLPDWVRSKYTYTIGHSDDDQNTSGLMIPFGPAELLITLDPDEPYRVGDTADPAKGPEGKHDGTQLINAAYGIGVHAETHSGQTGQMRLAGALTFSDVLAPGVLHAVKAGVSVAAVANQSTRSSTHVADAETGRVEDNRTKQILLSYKPNISFKVRTRRPGEQERPWREIKPTRIEDPGTERLNGWAPEHYLDKPAAHQVTATGEGVKHGKIPSHFYASGMENIPEMFDQDVNRLRAQGLVPDQGVRDQLLQKLGNHNAYLDKAVNGKRGYQFPLYDKYGKPVAIIRHYSGIVATATRRVGATSAEAHLEDVRTAIEGSSGSHTLTHSSTVTPLNIEVDLLPSPVKNADLGVGINGYVTYSNTHSDSSSAGQTSLWVVVPRYGKNTAAFELHFEHWAVVAVRGATTHPSRQKTGIVKGAALVRLTEPQAFEHGYPVEREALKQLPGPGATTVPFRPDAVRNTGRRPEDPQTKPVAKNVYQGKGIGSLGWVVLRQETVDAIHSAIRDEVRSKGFLSADVLAPFDREHGYTHGNKVASRVDNQALLDKMISQQGMGSHYDPVHQDGMKFTLRLRRGVLGADLDVDSVKVTVRGRRTPGKPPRYVRTTDEFHTVQLPMGMNSSGQSSSHSRKLAIGLKFKFLFRFLKAALSGVEVQRIVGATDSVSHLINRPELTETDQEVDEVEVTSDYLIDFEYQHSGQTGKIAEGRRNPPRVYIRNQTAAAYLLPLGIVESLAPEQMSQAELKRSKQPTPSHVMDHGAGFYVDATGLTAAAEAMLRDLVGAAGTADKDVSAFTGTAAVRAYLKELLNGEYTTDRPFDPGLFRDTFGALDISGTLGPSQFAGATASPYVLGLIYLFLLENRLTDNKAFGIAWEQLDLAFGGLAGPNIQRAGQPGYTGIAGVSGEWDVNRRWQWNEALFNGQTGGKELLQLNFNRVYVFRAAADYLVRGRQEKHSKFFPSDTQRPEPREVKDRTVLYVLGEPDALLQYAEGNVPVSDAQLKDAMTRWRGGDLRLNGDTVAGLLTRWRIDLDGRPKPVTADVADLMAFVDGLRQDMVQVHDLGGARIRNAQVRRDFGTAFGLELAEPLNPDRDISMPDDLVGYVEDGPALSDERLAEAMTAWNAAELALTGDVAAGILLRWKAEVPDLPGFDRDELVTTLSRRHTQEASPIRDDDVRGRFNETFERKLPLPPVPEDEIELPDHYTREDAGGRFLGHSGVQTFAHASGESTYQIVKKHVDKVARGMLTADAENWNSKDRVIGHLQGAVDSLQGMLAKHRDLAMLEEFQAPEGYSFILPHSVGWLLSDDVKVTIRIPSTSTSTPVRIDHVPNTGIEVYHHGYTTGGQSNSRDGSQGFTFFKLATGGTETTTASDNLNLKTSEGHHRGTSRANTIVKEQTTGDFGGHDVHKTVYVMEIHVERLDKSGFSVNNLLLRIFDRWTRHSATSGQTAPGTLELQIPDSIVRSRKERGPRPMPDLRPLPKLPGNGFVAGTTLDDARPIAHQMVYRMFKTPRVSRLLGTKVGGPNTRSSRSLPVLLSRLHLIGHLPETTDRGGYKMAGGLFDPGTSSERANVSLGGDLLDMEVLSRIEGSGVGRYSKHLSGTTVSASTDHTRATAEFSLIGSGPVGQPDGQPDTWALGTTHGRNTAFNDGVANTVNKRDEGHGKEQNPLYQVKFRWQGRSSGVKFLHRLFRAPKRAGDYHSHPIHGEVYTHHYQDEIDDLRADIAAAKAEIRPRLPQWPSMAQAPVFDLAPLLGGAAQDRLDPQRAYQGVARHIRTHGGGDRPIVLTADTKTLAAQTYAAVLPWAVRTMQADLVAARQIDPTVEPPRALRDYRFKLDARRIVGGAADSAESIAQATLEMINQVNAWHSERPGSPSDAPVALPREVAVLALDLANVGRDVASALQSHVRVDVTRSDGTVDQMWIGPGGEAYPFDPEQTRPDGSGALWVFDRTTSRSRYFSAAVAQRNGLLSPAQRADADAYRLTYTDMGRLYLAAPARQQSFEQAFNAEIDARGGRLGAIDPALPGLLYRAVDAHEFWQWEAERRHDHWNAADPLGSDLALSEWAHQAQLNEESAEEALRLLQDTARGGPGGPAWTDHDVRSITDRLSRLATAKGRDPGRSVTADETSGTEQLRAQDPELNPDGLSPEGSAGGPADPRAVVPGLAEVVERVSEAHRFWSDEVEWLNGQDRRDPRSVERAQANAEEAGRFKDDLRRTGDGAGGRWGEAEIGAVEDRLDAMAQDERAVLTPRVGYASRLRTGAESIAGLESDLAAAGPGAVSLVTVDERGMRYVAMNQDGRVAWIAYPSGRLAEAPAPGTGVSSLDLFPDGTLRDPSPEFLTSGPADGYLRRLHSSLASFVLDGVEERLRAEQVRAQDPELNLDGPPPADITATTSRANEVEEAAERAMRVESPARAAADLEQLTGELREQLGDPPAPTTPAPSAVNAVLLSGNNRRYGASPSQPSGGRVVPVLRRSAPDRARVRGMYRILHGNPDWASSAARYEAAAARAFGNREVIAAAGRIQARFHEWADAQAARRQPGEGTSGRVLAGQTADFGERMRLLLPELDGRAIGDTSFGAETRRELGGERLGYLLSDQPLELPVRLMLAYRELGLAEHDWPLFLKALMAGLMTDVLPREANPARLSMFEVLWAAHLAGIGGDRLSRAFNHGSSGMYAWVHEELRPSDGIRDQELIDSLDLSRLRNLYAAPAPAPASAPRPAHGEPGYEDLPVYESDASEAEAPPAYGTEDLTLPDPRGRLEARLAPPVLPPYDGTAADCAVRLEALRRELYGGSAVARDDFTVGSTRPEDELAAATGGDWRPLGSTADIERQVEELGAGATAFILVLSPTGPGHAFALRNEDGVLLWVETQARLGERVRHVGEDPPAPVIDARVIVADETGRAVPPDALTQAMSRRDGSRLPSLDRVYHAQGRELEVGAYVVHGHSAAAFRGEELLVRNRTTGVEVGTDGAELYLAGGRYFTSLRAARGARRGRVTTVAVNIIEITTLPEEVHQAERGIRYDPAVVDAGVRDVLRRLSNAVRLRDGAGGPGFRGTSVRDLFGDDPAYEFGRNADDLSVFRAVGFAVTMYPQLTEGVPLATTPTFLLSAVRYSEPADINRYLLAGFRFTGDMTRTYLDERVGRRVGRFAVPAMEYVPGVGDFRGAMLLLHTHAIAATHVYVVDSEEMAKNEVLAALRTSFAGVRGSLRDDDAAFLERNRDRIRAMLENAIRERLGRHISAYERRRRAPGVRPRRLFQYPLANPEMTLGDYVDNMLLPPERVRVRVDQEDAMVVRVNYAAPDYTLDIDLMLLEMRHLGADEQLLATVERRFRQFAELARWAYYVAERAERNATTVEGREYVETLIDAVDVVSAHRASRRGDIVADVRRFLDSAARRAPEAVSAPIFRGDVTTNVQADAIIALSEFIKYADRRAARQVRAAIEAIKRAVTEYRGASSVRSRRGDLADLRQRADGVISALRRFAHHSRSHHSSHAYPSREYVNRVASQATGWGREDAAPEASRWHDVRSAEGQSVGKAYYNDGDWRLRAPFYGELRNAEFLTWSGGPGNRVSAPVEVPLGDRSRVYLLAGHGSELGDVPRLTESEAPAIAGQGFTSLVLVPCTPSTTPPVESPALKRVAREFGLTIIETTGEVAPTPGAINLLPDAEGRPTQVRAYLPDGTVHLPGATRPPGGGLFERVLESETALGRAGGTAAHTYLAPDGRETSVTSAFPGSHPVLVSEIAAPVAVESPGTLVELPVLPQNGESFRGALVRALDLSNLAGARGEPGAPYDRLVAGLMEENLPASAPLVDDGRHIHIDDLERVGVALTSAQRTEAVLQNGTLPVAALDLDRVQRFRLAMETAPVGRDTQTEIAAALAAVAEGMGVRVVLGEAMDGPADQPTGLVPDSRDSSPAPSPETSSGTAEFEDTSIEPGPDHTDPGSKNETPVDERPAKPGQFYFADSAETTYAPQPTAGFGTGIYGQVIYRTDDEPLYHWDSQPPEVVFSEGLRPRSDTLPTSLRLYQQWLFGNGVVSTTRSPEIDVVSPPVDSDGFTYRYTLTASGGIGVNTSAQAVLFWKKVRPEHIERVEVFRYVNKELVLVNSYLKHEFLGGR